MMKNIEFIEYGNKFDKNKRLRDCLIDSLVLLILIFSLTTMYQSLFDKISINRIMGAFIIIAAGGLFCIGPKKKTFIYVSVLCIDAMFSCILTPNISTEINEWIFVLVTVLLMGALSDSRNIDVFIESLIKRKKLICILIHIECLTLLVLMIFKVGMKIEWGEGVYFVGLCNAEHTMGSLCCIILTIILLYCKINKKNYLWYMILSMIPMYAILQCGARVFLIPMVIIIIIFLENTVNNRMCRYIIYLLVIALFYIVIINSTMMDKFNFVSNNTVSASPLEAFTSGRSRFWIVDLQHYLSGNVFKLLFGSSFGEVYLVNKEKVNMFIWSHNDIVYLLNGGGLIGTIAYIGIINRTMGQVRKIVTRKKLKILLVLYVYLPMLLNGFMTYQHFVYSFIILYLAIILQEKNSSIKK